MFLMNEENQWIKVSLLDNWKKKSDIDTSLRTMSMPPVTLHRQKLGRFSYVQHNSEGCYILWKVPG